MDVTLEKILELKKSLWHPGHQLVHSCKICGHQQTHTQPTTSQSTILFLSSPPFPTIISVHTKKGNKFRVKDIQILLYEHFLTSTGQLRWGGREREKE